MSSFRICPDSGFYFNKPAESLMKVNAVAGVVALLVAGILGLGVVLTRWQEVHLLPADQFYQALTGHGINALIFWIIFFEMAILHFASTTLLRCRLATPRWAWFGFFLMLIGAVMNNVAVLSGNSSVMMTSYVPMQAEPHFYLGLILFAVGALIQVFVFFGTLVIAQQENTYDGSVPLVTFGAITAAIIAVFTIASGAIILVPTFLWSVGYISHIDAEMYRVIWWGMGHSSQQINVAAHVSIWYLLTGVLFGARPMSEKVSRFAFLLYILFLQLASAHHILVDPGIGTEWKIFNTSYAMYLAVLASMIHGLTVPGAMEVAQRSKGYTNGMFEWLRKAPWGNPVFSGMFISLVTFGFLGGITGVVMGTEQINLIIHNTIYVPAHFHATVVTGTTLAFMALTYLLIPVLFRRQIFLPGLAKIQPFLFGGGMTILILFMLGAGTLGVSRRHWDMDFTGALLTFEYPGMAYTLMAIGAIGGVLGVLGGGAYLLVTVGSLLFGKKLEPSAGILQCFAGLPLAASVYNVDKPEKLERAAPAEEHHGKGFEAPGTFVLALLLLVSFVVYYFINWKYLSSVWPMS
ncbi:MAG: cytochrome C oxidase subunit I [Gammaproteobacteria bacterium]|jgi:cytochrome c oxidase subunit 1|nr:cytochrome C oxidase subunit I [Gammaproteobacteria bacterium]MBT3725313.1 cytochrome C oxidase subunit I [Gammaproteobacteria bacterium]MBT4075023.1 cytochrome C oxidase subunit I [Gammaproteobacteria bacterium]MBT4195359.1 cytochrome C oxidase subunit I [Gammaproteobacteria bacterium]MBT4449662.1 cytochrome C oxidase subunit I [Gammaproteobacteria bacterium]